jgi:DNA-binding response OmpR family regulator
MVEYKALIIDDDIWMQRILSKTLQSYGFNTTLLASNGFEGVSIAVDNKPHIIVLDILMPDLSGHNTLKMLKAIRITKDIPVLMVSAMSDTENLGLAVKSGTSGFISKPFTRATIFEKLISIFGKEKLDQIQKGELIDNVDYYSGNLFEIEQEDNSLDQAIKTAAEKELQQSPKKVSQNTLKSRYKEEEKQSIESIKKLLLKTRK